MTRGGPDVEAKLIKDTRGLHRAIKRLSRDYKPGMSKEAVEALTGKSHYGYLEAKVHGILPLSAFAVCVSSKEMRSDCLKFLNQIGWKGDLITIRSKANDETDVAYAFRVTDAVIEWATKKHRMFEIVES